jgi:hypothetical protein
MLGSLDALALSVDALQEGVGPLGRIAGRWSRRGRGGEEPEALGAEEPDADGGEDTAAAERHR